MSEFKSYDAALRSKSSAVWPGCKGEGRCRPCGNVHDFQRTSYDDKGAKRVHEYACLQNHEYGCPTPKPEATHDYNRAGNCRVCGFSRAHIALIEAQP